MIAVALAAACTPGQITDPGGSSGGPGAGGTSPERAAATCSAPVVAPRPLRRLTPEQYTNTVRDLLGDPGFSTELDSTDVITERGVRQLRAAAERALSRKAEWSAEVFPCDPSGTPDDACAPALVDSFATRAFRRPLTAEERTWLNGVYADARAALSFREALEVLVEVILQAPQTVYVAERGVAREGLPTGVRALNDWELASRLSYFLTSTMPDAPLFEAAAAGTLASGSSLRDHAERLLMDPRSEQTIQRFTWHWLQLDGGRLHNALEEAAKDAATFPEYDDALKAAMRTELEAFVRRVVIEEDASFERLLLDTSAYVNGPLARLYGVEDGPNDESTWAWVELPASQRGGLLTRAAFLTVFASSNVHSPIRRGVFVVEEMLCNALGEPPPNASDTPIEGGTVDDGSGGTVVRTVRQDVEARTSDTQCAGCHGVINPVGFSFERYDAIGRWQETELGTGLPIDDSGRIQGSDVDGPVDGALELSQALARSARARSCYARRWMTHALGQAPGELDRCAVESVERRFADSGSVRELLLAIVESDAFRYVNVGEEGR